jgi:hypothetical protein
MTRPVIEPTKTQHLRPFEGRVTATSTHATFQLDEQDRWFRMPPKWKDLRPDIGLYVYITVSPQNEIVQMKVRSAFRDRVIEANKELEQI